MQIKHNCGSTLVGMYHSNKKNGEAHRVTIKNWLWCRKCKLPVRVEIKVKNKFRKRS